MKTYKKMSLATQRAAFSLLLQTTPTVRGTTVTRTVADGVPVAWVVPPDSRSGEVLFYVHGGGYCWGSIESHRSFVSQLAAAVGCKALMVEYRRSPENPFPAALEDALATYRWLRVREQGSRIAIAGESAGGGLALSLMLSIKSEVEAPATGFLLSPWVDLYGRDIGTELSTDTKLSMMDRRLRSTAERYANGANLRDPRISPLYGDLSSLPPLLIHAGKQEFLARDSVALADKARRQGVDVTFEQYEGKMHALHTFVHVSKQAREYLYRAADFLARHLRSKLN